MAEIQLRGVKAEAANWVGAAPVCFVADDRMPAFGQMDADLVLASCFKPDLDKRRLWIPFDHVHMRNCEFSCGGLPG